MVILIAVPVVATPVVRADSFQAGVDDAWIEEVTHLEYRFLFFEREIRDGRYRLVTVLDPRSPLPGSSRLVRLAPRAASAEVDTVRFGDYIGGEGQQRTHIEIGREVPDSIWLALITTGGRP